MIIILLCLFGILMDLEAEEIKPAIIVKVESITDQLIKVTIPDIGSNYKGRVYEVTPSNIFELLKDAELYGGDYILGYDRIYFHDYQFVKFTSVTEFNAWLGLQNWKEPKAAGLVGVWCFLAYTWENELIEGDNIQLDIVLWDLKFEHSRHYKWAHNTDNKEKEKEGWPGRRYWGVAFEISDYPKIIPEIYSGAGHRTKFKLQKQF
jgi:hypothetical protein